MYESKIATKLELGTNYTDGWTSTGGINFVSVFAFIDGHLR